MNELPRKLLEIRNLRKVFPVSRPILDVMMRRPQKYVKSVDDVSADIYEKEILALVGESGCGKSTFARTVIRLYHPDSGQIVFNGQDITALKGKDLRDVRRQMQMVFQDPYSSLNPRTLIRDLFKEELLYHHMCTKDEVREKSIELLKMVEMGEHMLDRFPSELSGGQRQRIGIARALALNPRFLITDEPVSALDVSIQAQILNLLQKLKQELGLTILFISHDLRVVRYLADRVAVMYLGKIVEQGSTEEVYENPLHPYTEILIRSSPNLDPRMRSETTLIEGNPPSPIDIPKGCRFCERCPRAVEICFQEEPQLLETESGHFSACHQANHTVL